ncbi:hypothetical protein P4C99_01435 [Pontiellaceae bacterium B1224]|nr:hypothetical protein [Pontiellaceae bacterium B1224]
MHFKGIFLMAAIAGLTFSGWADEDAMQKKNDISVRISVGTAPGITEEDIEGINHPCDEEDGWQLEALAVKRIWFKKNPNFGYTLGGGLFVSSFGGTRTDNGDEYDADVFGITGQIGLAYQIGKYIIVEGTPYFGFGFGQVDLNGSDGGLMYTSYGVKGGLYLLLSEKIELGFEAGYQGFSSEYSLETVLGEYEVDLTGDGPLYSAVLAIKF